MRCYGWKERKKMKTRERNGKPWGKRNIHKKNRGRKEEIGHIEKINRGIRLGKEYIQNGNGGNCEEITKSLLRKNRKEQKK